MDVLTARPTRFGRTMALVFALACVPATSAAAVRSTVDRPDDFPAHTQQVHVMYVVPTGGIDREYDRNGAIEASVAVASAWMSGETAGKPLRFDSAAGVLDVTFVQLTGPAETDAALAAQGSSIRDALEAALDARGFTDPFKLYGVYYDGSAQNVCASGAWPPVLLGHVMAVYLKGDFTNPAIPDCDTQPFAAVGAPPAYREYAFLHEVVHLTGSVPPCAPHFGFSGHTVDLSNDLMYTGASPWVPDTLDPGHDDYYGHPLNGCLDLAASGYIVGNAAAALPGETLPPPPPAETPPAATEPPPPAAVTPVVGPLPPPRDVAGPSAVLGGSTSQVLGKTVTVDVGCRDETCTVVVRGTVRTQVDGKRRTSRLEKVTRSVGRGMTVSVKLRVSKSQRAAIKRALRRGQRVVVRIEVTATDAAGNATVMVREVRLRR